MPRRSRLPAPGLGLLLAGLLMLAACAPHVTGLGPPVTTPAIEDGRLRMADGTRLPLHEWQPEGAPRATLLALHGLNDHARSFILDSAPPLREGGLHILAYDQRGHAENPDRGLWPGHQALASDAVSAIRLLRARHPDRPFFVLGESMGANAALLAGHALRESGEAGLVDGWILLSPGLFTLDEMNPVTAAAFRLLLVKFPAFPAGSSAPTLAPTDNWAVLDRFQSDPLTLKSNRLDAIAGLLAMNAAAKAEVPRCCAGPTLFLYGARDRVIEMRPTAETLRRLPAQGGGRVALYREGWHILLRDLQRAVVTTDILAFIAAPGAPLPSGADREGAAWVARGAL